MVREYAGDLGPKGLGVIGLDKVAELVDNDVIGELWWQECDAIVEVHIAQTARAAPFGPLLADADPPDTGIVNLIEMP
jgi:hypothetical protein